MHSFGKTTRNLASSYPVLPLARTLTLLVSQVSSGAVLRFRKSSHMFRSLFLLVTHLVALAIGFALGVYYLPILTAPPSPDQAELRQMSEGALYTAEFTRELRGSDVLHWGEGAISVGNSRIVHEGALAPGPDYKLYLVPEFVEHEDEFLPLKNNSVIVGDVKTFEGLILDVPSNVNVDDFTTVLIWCEAFGEFITAAKYR